MVVEEVTVEEMKSVGSREGGRRKGKKEGMDVQRSGKVRKDRCIVVTCE